MPVLFVRVSLVFWSQKCLFSLGSIMCFVQKKVCSLQIGVRSFVDSRCHPSLTHSLKTHSLSFFLCACVVVDNKSFCVPPSSSLPDNDLDLYMCGCGSNIHNRHTWWCRHTIHTYTHSQAAQRSRKMDGSPTRGLLPSSLFFALPFYIYTYIGTDTHRDTTTHTQRCRNGWSWRGVREGRREKGWSAAFFSLLATWGLAS